jgi:hypothetical protein
VPVPAGAAAAGNMGSASRVSQPLCRCKKNKKQACGKNKKLKTAARNMGSAARVYQPLCKCKKKIKRKNSSRQHGVEREPAAYFFFVFFAAIFLLLFFEYLLFSSILRLPADL